MTSLGSYSFLFLTLFFKVLTKNEKAVKTAAPRFYLKIILYILFFIRIKGIEIVTDDFLNDHRFD